MWHGSKHTRFYSIWCHFKAYSKPTHLGITKMCRFLFFSLNININLRFSTSLSPTVGVECVKTTQYWEHGPNCSTEQDTTKTMFKSSPAPRSARGAGPNASAPWSQLLQAEASRSPNRWRERSPASRSSNRGVGRNYIGSATAKLHTGSIHFLPSCRMNQPPSLAHAAWGEAAIASQAHAAPHGSWKLAREVGVVESKGMEEHQACLVATCQKLIE